MLSTLVFAAALALPAQTAATNAGPDVVVVCPDELNGPLTPWIEHRRRQGHRLAVVPSAASAAVVRQSIREVYEQGGLRFVVLVGDVDHQRPTGGVPTHLARAKINVHWGSSPEIATDHFFADLTGDGSPEVAVGRLSVDTPQQLAHLVRKILDYERAADGMWQRRINVVAGTGGFGLLADTVIEAAAKRFITGGIPAEFETTMTYASWRSPYCPDPRDFRHTTLARLNEGCLFWVYIGHGHPQRLDRVRLPQARFAILEADDVAQLSCRRGQPIALMLACYTAAFDGPRDCLAEQMLRREGGPVAVIGGSRVTMPYAMAVMAEGMLDGMFHKRRETLGEVMLDARAALLTEQAAGGNRQLLDAVAKAISPRPDELAAERAEHVLLFHLLGDPLLRIPRGEPLRVSCPRTGTAGEPLEVAVEGNVTGGYLVELVCRRDRFRHPPGNRRELDTSHDGLAALTDVYAKANQRAWTTVAGAAENGSFSVTLPVPSEAAGPCHVRVVVEGDDQLALGAADVYVRQPRPEPAAQSTNAAGVDAASKE